MRKNYVLLKQYVLALTLLLTTTIIIYSCKKDLGSSQLSNAELSDLRNWYESNSGKVINDRFQKMKPIWDDVFVSDHDDQLVYELNLENPDQVFQVINATVVKEKSSTNRNLIKLLIFKNKKTSKIDYGVYQSILNEGSLLNLEQLHYKQMNGLSGKVMYYNFDGSFSNGWNYASGEVTNSIQPIEQSIYLNAQLDRLSRNQQKETSSKEKLQLAYPDECIGKITEYGVACAGVEGYMVCNVYEKGSSYFNACGGGNGKGGNGGGYQPPGGSGGTPYFDCAGVKNGKAIESPCGCIGGTTGLESCGQKVDIDPEARQCLKDIKAKLEVLGMKNTALSTGLISEVLNSLNLSKGSNFNAIINEAVLSNGIVAETTLITNPNSWGSQGYVSKITFNTSVLNTATDLKLVATMMHEYIHAYFDWNMYLIRTGQKSHDSDFEKNYKILFDESGDPLPDSFGNAAQHEQIATSFVSNISAMLKSYAISESIPFPADPNYFEKMGWVGLQKTKAGTFAPNGTWYTTNAESGTSSPTITQTIKCKKL